MQLFLWRLNRHRTVANKVCQEFVVSFPFYSLCVYAKLSKVKVCGEGSRVGSGLWRLKTFALDKGKDAKAR